MKKTRKEQQKEIKKQLKAEKKRLKKERPLYKKIFKGLAVTTAIGGTTLLVGGGAGGYYLWDKYGDTVQKSVTKGFEIAKDVKATDFNTKSPTVFYDKNGKVLKTFKEYQYQIIDYKKINPLFVKGLVSAEDERFYQHHGVDLYGTLRGVSSIIKGTGVQGGSTITQQLVRNVILEDSEQTVERKLTEQVVAQEIEKKMDKNEIIQDYLNNVYFGNGNYGIGPAAKYYFSKDQSKLNPAEVATIIGTTNNPSVFDPVNKPKNAIKKRNRVLKKMYIHHVITKEEYNHYITTNLNLKIKKHGIDNSIHEYALSYAVHKATETLMAQNGFIFQYVFKNNKAREKYKESYNQEYLKTRQEILNGGYNIRTSIDMTKQKELENIVQSQTYPYWGRNLKTGFHTLQASVTTVDNKTGEVTAIVGGRGDKGDVYNRAYQGYRQPGSTIKPLVAYTPAFERGYTPSSVMTDRAIYHGPKNVYAGYKGPVTLRYALQISINTIPYRLVNEMGTNVMMTKLSKLKFSNLAPEDKNPILAVGGFTYGTTTTEMAGGYSTIENQGLWRETTNIKSIQDSVTGKYIYKNNHKQKRVYDADASYMMLDAMKSVMKGQGTGVKGQPNNYKHVAAKTGTTNDNKDSWFAGVTPYYSTVVWIGNDTPSWMNENQKALAASIFKKWAEELHRGKKDIDFKKPVSLKKNNGNWHTTVNTIEYERKNRLYLDTFRQNKEAEEQRIRLAKEDYRIKYHLTKEEEIERENKAKEAISEFYQDKLTTLDDYDEFTKRLAKVKKLILAVKHQEAQDTFMKDYATLEANLYQQKAEIEAEIARKKAEEEAKKQAALEEKRRKEAEEKARQEAEKRAEWEKEHPEEAQEENEAETKNEIEDEAEQTNDVNDVRPSTKVPVGSDKNKEPSKESTSKDEHPKSDSKDKETSNQKEKQDKPSSQKDKPTKPDTSKDKSTVNATDEDTTGAIKKNPNKESDSND